jgi:hypothetical protein
MPLQPLPLSVLRKPTAFGQVYDLSLVRSGAYVVPWRGRSEPLGDALKLVVEQVGNHHNPGRYGTWSGAVVRTVVVPGRRDTDDTRARRRPGGGASTSFARAGARQVAYQGAAYFTVATSMSPVSRSWPR